jgi:uncharacterized membrane protein YfcA
MNDLGFYSLAVVAVMFTGLSKAGFAGFGIVATPLLATIVPPLQAVAILLPIMLLQDLVAVWAYRRNWEKWNLFVLVPSSFFGICIAWSLASHLADTYVRLTVGVFALMFAVHQWLCRKSVRESEINQPRAVEGVFWGIVGGISGTLANAAGPPFQIYVLPQKLDKLTFAGTMAVYFAVLNAMKVAPIFALGKFSMENIGLSLALLPVSVATVFFGVWILRVLPIKMFYGIAYGLLFAVAVELIGVSVWQLV